MNPAHCCPTENKFGTCLTAGFRPGGASYFLLLRQKKVSKEKATPGYAVGFADFPALLETPGGWLNSPAAQTTPADGPRRFCVARRFTRGPQSGTRPTTGRFFDCCDHRNNGWPQGRPGKMAKITYPFSTTDALPGPLSGAEQRRGAGGFGLPCLSRRRVQASRPAHRVAQGTGQRPAPNQGWPFLWLLSFGHTKESTPASQAETQV